MNQIVAADSWTEEIFTHTLIDSTGMKGKIQSIFFYII